MGNECYAIEFSPWFVTDRDALGRVKNDKRYFIQVIQEIYALFRLTVVGILPRTVERANRVPPKHAMTVSGTMRTAVVMNPGSDYVVESGDFTVPFLRTQMRQMRS